MGEELGEGQNMRCGRLCFLFAQVRSVANEKGRPGLGQHCFLPCSLYRPAQGAMLIGQNLTCTNESVSSYQISRLLLPIAAA